MTTKKPTPLIDEPDKKICPVCNRRSYSAAGIHPQCAIHQADAPRREKIKQAKVLKDKQKSKGKDPNQISWNQKKCPKCGATMHVRKKVCDCGCEVGKKP